MDGLVGSRMRTDTLVSVARLGTTYPSEIAAVLGKRPIEIQRALSSLERAALVATRRVGTVRLVELNRQLPEYPELLALLLKISERPVYKGLWTRTRRRPRGMGKAIR